MRIITERNSMNPPTTPSRFGHATARPPPPRPSVTEAGQDSGSDKWSIYTPSSDPDSGSELSVHGDESSSKPSKTFEMEKRNVDIPAGPPRLPGLEERFASIDQNVKGMHQSSQNTLQTMQDIRTTCKEMAATLNNMTKLFEMMLEYLQKEAASKKAREKEQEEALVPSIVMRTPRPYSAITPNTPVVNPPAAAPIINSTAASDSGQSILGRSLPPFPTVPPVAPPGLRRRNTGLHRNGSSSLSEDQKRRKNAKPRSEPLCKEEVSWGIKEEAAPSEKSGGEAGSGNVPSTSRRYTTTSNPTARKAHHAGSRTNPEPAQDLYSKEEMPLLLSLLIIALVLLIPLSMLYPAAMKKILQAPWSILSSAPHTVFSILKGVWNLLAYVFWSVVSIPGVVSRCYGMVVEVVVEVIEDVRMAIEVVVAFVKMVSLYAVGTVLFGTVFYCACLGGGS